MQLCQRAAVPLPDKSVDFLRQISRYSNRPSAAQLTWLHGLVMKCPRGLII